MVFSLNILKLDEIGSIFGWLTSWQIHVRLNQSFNQLRLLPSKIFKKLGEKINKMISVEKNIQSICVWLVLVILGLSGSGCTISADSAPRLRIINSGRMVVPNLSVLFPEDEIHFGDISPGTTTDYLEVPNGVYGYAAFRYELDGQMIIQPVIDWVGAAPLEGEVFTYEIDYSSNRFQGEMVRLIHVTIDE